MIELVFQTFKRKELDRIGLEHDLVKIDDELTGRAVSVRVPAITFCFFSNAASLVLAHYKRRKSVNCRTYRCCQQVYLGIFWSRLAKHNLLQHKDNLPFFLVFACKSHETTNPIQKFQSHSGPANFTRLGKFAVDNNRHYCLNLSAPMLCESHYETILSMIGYRHESHSF